MSYSSTYICNLALIKLGQKAITDITEDSNPARLCNRIYGQVRDELEQAGPQKGWKFCRHRVSISVSSDEPDFEYDYQYQIPANPFCLRIVKVMAGGVEITDWEREGDFILTNLESSEIDLKYVKRVTDEAKFPPHFVKVLAMKMVVELSYNLSQSSAQQERYLMELERYMPKAIALDEQEKYVEEENTSWVDIGRTTTTIT